MNYSVTSATAGPNPRAAADDANRVVAPSPGVAGAPSPIAAAVEDDSAAAAVPSPNPAAEGDNSDPAEARDVAHNRPNASAASRGHRHSPPAGRRWRLPSP